MELHETLQALRKAHKLTQEELAERLFVSRTAISKWESGRGYPSIDSLKAIAAFFSVSIDSLLSGRELLSLAETDNQRKRQQQQHLIFGLLDCAGALLLLLPLYGLADGDFIRQVPFFALAQLPLYLKISYISLAVGSTLWGLILLVLQGSTHASLQVRKLRLSLALSIFGVLLFIASLEPYAALFCFSLLLIKGIILGKTP